jgi:hypothetical protein
MGHPSEMPRELLDELRWRPWMRCEGEVCVNPAPTDRLQQERDTRLDAIANRITPAQYKDRLDARQREERMAGPDWLADILIVDTSIFSCWIASFTRRALYCLHIEERELSRYLEIGIRPGGSEQLQITFKMRFHSPWIQEALYTSLLSSLREFPI